MSLTVGMTIYDRPSKVMDAVFSSFKNFPGNDRYEKMLIVNDRGDRARLYASLAWTSLEAEVIDMEGSTGYRGQIPAMNRLFSEFTTSHLYCISSDCIQLPGSVETAAWLADKFPDMVIFGKAIHCGRKYDYVDNGTHRTKTILCHMAGVLEGYAWILPRSVLSGLDYPGYDPALASGLCYEHLDLVQRMLGAGTEFIVCDDICAVHIEHPKPYLSDQARVEKNRAIMVAKHGVAEPDSRSQRRIVTMGCLSFWFREDRDDSYIGDVAGVMNAGYGDLV